MSSEITSAKLNQVAEKINKQLEQKPENKDLKKAYKLITDDYLPRLQKYEEQEQILGSRNSYSKTDIDATFMRMKDDHMMNGQLKAAYNVQMGTENQYISGFSVHQRPCDTSCLIPHFQELESNLGTLPANAITAADYGSEENYNYLPFSCIKNIEYLTKN